MQIVKSKHFWRFPVYLFYISLLFGSFYFDLFFLLGCLLVMFGMFLYFRSRKELQSNYSSYPTIFKKHKLVKTGPYKHIRHPSYAGSFISMLGLLLISKSIVSLVYCLVVCIPFGFYKINLEEKLLGKKFGKEFKKYKQTTPMIIPKITSLLKLRQI